MFISIPIIILIIYTYMPALYMNKKKKNSARFPISMESMQTPSQPPNQAQVYM